MTSIQYPPLKQAPASWNNLAERAWAALDFPGRLPILIGIDGLPGAGKSSLASWLAWQLGMKAVHLDLYLTGTGPPPSWRVDDLRRVIEARARLARPVIVEGIMLLDALGAVERTPDFLAYVEREEPSDSRLAEHVVRYLARTKCPERAHV